MIASIKAHPPIDNILNDRISALGASGNHDYAYIHSQIGLSRSRTVVQVVVSIRIVPEGYIVNWRTCDERRLVGNEPGHELRDILGLAIATE